MAKEAVVKNNALVNRIKAKRKTAKYGKAIAWRPPPDLDPLVREALKHVSQAELLTEWARAFYGMPDPSDQAQA